MTRIGIRLVLRQQKAIRGEVFPAGAVLLEGECGQGIHPDDVHKAIIMNQVDIFSKEIPDPESGKKEPARKKKSDVVQDQA